MWSLLLLTLISMKTFAGNEFLCWLIAPSDAWRKCLLVGLSSSFLSSIALTRYMLSKVTRDNYLIKHLKGALWVWNGIEIVGFIFGTQISFSPFFIRNRLEKFLHLFLLYMFRPLICTCIHEANWQQANCSQVSFMDWFVLVELLRTLVGILDDYFDGYYTEEMIESQVIFIKIFLVTVVVFALAYILMFIRFW